ncbi:MAG: PHP domain-containing protein [Anaerolineae bacterium]|nr:PHP domain-containing protein [Gloeobacterales cyanobacterium ES-bin-313]
MIELHCHTTMSDGTLTPTELVVAARNAGVQAIAITDHDTLSGWTEAQTACDVHGLELIPGLELSTTHEGHSLHVLGFYPRAEELAPFLVERHRARIDRAEKIVAKLAALGFPIDMPQVKTPGRFHIAHALREAGYIKDEQDAFRRWLSDSGPAFVPYGDLSAAEGIRVLRECGAVPVWAHPLLFRGGSVESVLPILVAAGLQGIEVYHSEHTPRQSARLLKLAQRYDLVPTGGSDFHGTNKDGVTLNMLHLPLSLLPPLKARITQPLEYAKA